MHKRFTAALCKELVLAQELYNLELKTIYFGGGTPSMLSVELFRAIALALPAHHGAEFTIEVNPATVTESKADAWIRSGVNRISLGAQSFDTNYLKLLGRQHTPEDIPETVRMLRFAGFQNINLDLMFALPMMPEETWEKTLNCALKCEPQHISAYALTYEEDTPFYDQLESGTFKVDEEREIRMFNMTVDLLHNAGLEPYEISNFALPGYESTHNQAYWRGSDYLGVGPSACSTIGTQRWKNFEDTEAYIVRMDRNEDIRTEIEIVTPEIRQRERIMFGLRTRNGIEIEWVASYPVLVHRLIKEGLAVENNDRLVLTPRGRLVADSVAEQFAAPMPA